MKSLGIEKAVSLCGWLDHAEVLRRFSTSDVFLFPSVRDNGAGVVFEALASGAVPVVVDFGGPGDIVQPEFGYKVPLTNETDVVAQMEKAFQVSMNVYRHPTEARTFFSPDREPSLNLSVPVARISGLNNFSIPRPMLSKAAQNPVWL